MGELGSKVRTASCYHNKRAEIQERQWRIQVAYLQLNIIFPRPGRSLLKGCELRQVHLLSSRMSKILPCLLIHF